MKNSIKKLFGPVQIIVLALIISAVGGYVNYTYATAGDTYTEPGCAPTGCNASAPINVSGSMQFKSGGLTLATGAGITTGFVLTNGKAGIGTTVPTEKLTVNGKIAFPHGSDQADAGKMDYRGFDPVALSIVGAGTAIGNRVVHLFDKLYVDTICKSDGTNCITPGGGSSGVSKIIAGTNITISPTSGVGDVTVNATGGGTGGITCYISGPCSPPYVPRFFSNGTIINGIIQDGGTSVGIGMSPPSGYKLAVNGTVQASGFFYSSDRTLKTNISPLQDSLNKVLQLQGVSYNLKENGKADIGVIAQDVEKIYPDVVSTNAVTGLKSVDYGHLVAPLIEAVKAQQKEIDDLKAEVQELQSKR